MQGLAFLPKTECNVRDVEVAVGLMLTRGAIEPVAFKVPRVRVSRPLCRPLVDTGIAASDETQSFCRFFNAFLSLLVCAERVLPGRRVPRHHRVVGTGADRLRVAVRLQRPTQEDEPEAQRHDARYKTDSRGWICADHRPGEGRLKCFPSSSERSAERGSDQEVCACVGLPGGEE